MEHEEICFLLSPRAQEAGLMSGPSWGVVEWDGDCDLGRVGLESSVLCPASFMCLFVYMHRAVKGMPICPGLGCIKNMC